MAWDTVWDLAAGDSFSGSLVCDNLDVASNERYHVYSGAPLVSLAGSHHSDGDIIQDFNIFNLAQTCVDAVCLFFADTTHDYNLDAGPTDQGDWYWTSNNLRTEAGIDTSGWYAEIPKEITTTSDTTLVDGDSVVNGDKALHTGEGRVYERVAGVWVLLGGVGSNKPDRKINRRKCAAGDFLIKTTHQEIKDAFDLLRWAVTQAPIHTHFRPAWDGENHVVDWSIWERVRFLQESFRTISGSWSDAPSARGDADTLYAASNNGGSGLGPNDSAGESDDGSLFYDMIVSSSQIGNNYGPGPTDYNFSAEVDASRTKMRIKPFAGALVHYSSEWYIKATAPYYGYEDTTPVTSVFDANGCDVVQDVWHLIDTQGPSLADQTTVYVGMDRSASQPTWSADPTPPMDGEDSTVRGWEFGTPYSGALVIMKFDVTSGFSMID